MKAFAFRLEQARRWRHTQVSLQKSRVAAAAGRVAETEAILKTLQAELHSAATNIRDVPTGGSLESYAGFRQRSRTRISACEAQVLATQRALALELTRLIEADRKLRLLDNLRRSDEERWRRQFDRELAAFADEAFLCRLQSKT